MFVFGTTPSGPFVPEYFSPSLRRRRRPTANHGGRLIVTRAWNAEKRYRLRAMPQGVCDQRLHPANCTQGCQPAAIGLAVNCRHATRKAATPHAHDAVQHASCAAPISTRATHRLQHDALMHRRPKGQRCLAATSTAPSRRRRLTLRRHARAHARWTSYHNNSYHVAPYYIIPRHTMSYRSISHHIRTHHGTPHHVNPHNNVLRHRGASQIQQLQHNAAQIKQTDAKSTQR